MDSQEAKWAQKCFHVGPRQLSEQLYLWTMPWPRATVGIWSDFGPTPLPLLEITLIGVAYICFPDTLSNVKGVPRR